jgi:hypothetical protein
MVNIQYIIEVQKEREAIARREPLRKFPKPRARKLKGRVPGRKAA